MRTLLYVTTFLGLIGLAFWAYRENYETKAALDNVDRLHRDIADARARLAILKAEWAYLNRPDRLRDLAEINFPLHPISMFRCPYHLLNYQGKG